MPTKGKSKQIYFRVPTVLCNLVFLEDIKIPSSNKAPNKQKNKQEVPYEPILTKFKGLC